MNPEPELTLVVPVYDEAENIVPFLQEVVTKIQIPHQALVIYDDDADSTLHRMGEAQATHGNVVFVKNSFGRGVINAFRTGFAAARTPFIVPIMADLSDTPETVKPMYTKILEGYDLVVGSRYAPGGRKIGGPRLKNILSRFANRSLHLISDIPTHDMTNAFIMYRRELIDEIEITSTGGFEITMEIIAKAYQGGYRISEVPTVNRDRSAGKSKFHLFRWILQYLYWYTYIVVFSLIRKFGIRRV
jgi:glycosyltransferase involved in cell wall biosynthesis